MLYVGIAWLAVSSSCHSSLINQAIMFHDLCSFASPTSSYLVLYLGKLSLTKLVHPSNILDYYA